MLGLDTAVSLAQIPTIYEILDRNLCPRIS
jgi:hypothetical protein